MHKVIMCGVIFLLRQASDDSDLIMHGDQTDDAHDISPKKDDVLRRRGQGGRASYNHERLPCVCLKEKIDIAPDVITLAVTYIQNSKLKMNCAGDKP